MAGALSFDWDIANIDHISRHNVTPVEVEQVFANVAEDVDHDNSEGEERWASIGHTDTLRVLVVVWTMRGEAIRTVTAWETNRRMRQQYFSKRGIGR
jgi:uncharacterized DUF497 family protein